MSTLVRAAEGNLDWYKGRMHTACVPSKHIIANRSYSDSWSEYPGIPFRVYWYRSPYNW